MNFRNFLAFAASASLVSAPVIAQDSAGRHSEPSAESSELNRGSSAILLILAVAAVIAGVLIAVGGDDDDAVSA